MGDFVLFSGGDPHGVPARGRKVAMEMTVLERKVNALVQVCLARTPEERAQCTDALRLATLAAPEQHRPDRDGLIRAWLLDIGIPDHLKGHRYLCAAIAMAVEDPSTLEAMVKGLYPAVAQQYDTRWENVERSMRHAIELAWERGDLQVLSGYFGNTVTAWQGKPANSAFIARGANIVRQRLQDGGGAIS